MPRRVWLALIVALVPALVTHAAFLLSVRDGFVPACVPYWDGCTSISRAARNGDANLLFKAVMIPIALLSAWLWREAWQWLRAQGRAPGPALRTSGGVAAVALGVYVGFLGDAGEFAAWLRRYGALAYFAATYLAQIGLVRHAWHLGHRAAALRVMLFCCVLTLLFGLANVAASAALEDPLKDRLENAIEWTLGLLFTVWYLAAARFWHVSQRAAPAQPGRAGTPASPR